MDKNSMDRMAGSTPRLFVRMRTPGSDVQCQPSMHRAISFLSLVLLIANATSQAGAPGI